MTAAVRWVLCGAAVGLASVAPHGAGDPGAPPADALGAAGDRYAEAVRGAVDGAVAAGVAPDWAGHYHSGDGLGFNFSLSLAPGAGFVHEWHGCLGLYERNYGAVAVEGPAEGAGGGGRVTLRPALPAGEMRAPWLHEPLVFVRWGPVRSLVPEGSLVEFCNTVNGGWQTRGGPGVLRHTADAGLEPAGTPDVPAEVRPFLLDEPIVAEVTAVGPASTRPSVADWAFHDRRATLNVGADDGVRVGMAFHGRTPETATESAVVRSVEAGRCEVVFTGVGAPAEPAVGWELSTRSALADREAVYGRVPLVAPRPAR